MKNLEKEIKEIEKEFENNFLGDEWYHKKNGDRYYTVEVLKIKQFLSSSLRKIARERDKEIKIWIENKLKDEDGVWGDAGRADAFKQVINFLSQEKKAKEWL